MASKFSNQPAAPAPVAQPAAAQPPADDEVSSLPKIVPNKNAVLAHANRSTGDAPYTPAPPKSSQPGFLGVLRRLSSNNSPTTNAKGNHGLVERRVLNVDKNRERSRVPDLNQAKLKRVAFCVDVEIAPMPRYSDEKPKPKQSIEQPAGAQKLADKEKSEADALKNPEEAKQQKDEDGADKPEPLPKDTEQERAATPDSQPKTSLDGQEDSPKGETTRKKEKKKKSEAERKAKKEQKRKEAMEKGTIPMEIHLESDSSSEDVAVPRTTPPSQTTQTTNPARIYRRCCQLRETDILTKITGQLPETADACVSGIVEKLDLTDYFLSLNDLATLGDFLAVVPVKELILENCGLTDEGVRVILAGLLAARRPQIKYRRPITKPVDIVEQGGLVERLVLKNNKVGSEGWKHICLFIHLCRSIKSLDLSNLPFPAPAGPMKTPLSQHLHPHHAQATPPLDLSLLLAKSMGERLAGSDLELINMGATGLNANQLGAFLDGATKSGITRVVISHNSIDAQGIQHVARYLREGNCEGLDMSGNDLRDHLGVLAEAIDKAQHPLWALSLANCNLSPSSICQIFPKLANLGNFKFLDLSHNQDLFSTKPSATGTLRRYLPKMENLKRLHLADVSMSSDDAIAIAEILPEVKTLAHINLLENPDLESLAEAKQEQAQGEAAALYASLLAAVRVSKCLVKVDIDDPSADSGELLKAMANQLVAYCMRNLQDGPDLRDSAIGDSVKYPDVLRHLIGHEEDFPIVEVDDSGDPAPDEDYVIGGTAVVKALTCCLKNRGEDSLPQSGEFLRGLDAEAAAKEASLSSSKAKDMSKHLLASARKIRVRLQPALNQAKASSKDDMDNYKRLVFLDQTIEGIIERFEDEYPDTRVPKPSAPDRAAPAIPQRRSNSISSGEAEADAVALSDNEETALRLTSRNKKRSSSVMSTNRALADEEGRALRAGHQFRRSFLKPEHYDLIIQANEVENDPAHNQMVKNLLDELTEDHADLRQMVQEKGIIQTFTENKDDILNRLRQKDPHYWEIFIESQEKARANIHLEANSTANLDSGKPIFQQAGDADESAIED